MIALTHTPLHGDWQIAILARNGLRSKTAVSEVITLPTRLPESVILVRQ
jgi:hypothetical protein